MFRISFLNPVDFKTTAAASFQRWPLSFLYFVLCFLYSLSKAKSYFDPSCTLCMFALLHLSKFAFLHKPLCFFSSGILRFQIWAQGFCLEQTMWCFLFVVLEKPRTWLFPQSLWKFLASWFERIKMSLIPLRLRYFLLVAYCVLHMWMPLKLPAYWTTWWIGIFVMAWYCLFRIAHIKLPVYNSESNSTYCAFRLAH